MMLGTMISTGSKQILLQLGCRNISYLKGRSCAPLYRFPSQQSQQSNNRFVSSSAAVIEVEEPSKRTYGEIISNRNKPSEAHDDKPVQKKEEFTYGHIRWINREKEYAIIRDEVSNEKIYLNFRYIDTSKAAQINAKYINPIFNSGTRVRFKVRSDLGGARTAYDVQRWNGNKIPLLHYKHALKIALKARAWLGHRCYEILDEGEDAAAISEKIRTAYEESNKSTEWARRQLLVRSNYIIRECKAELGSEVFDILENIYQIDDVERRIEEAFSRCEKTLNELELLGVREEEQESLDRK